MTENISVGTPLSETKIKDAAIARLTQEKTDFENFKGTKMFSKLLGVYSKKKDEACDESYVFNKNLGSHGMIFAEGVKEKVYEILCNFIHENIYFASSILKARGSFTHCLAYAIHEFIDNDSNNKQRSAYLPDHVVYQRAVEFYFPQSEVEFKMEIKNTESFKPISVTDKDITENQEYQEALSIAAAEKLAEERKEAERKAKAEKDKKEREAKEAKRKAREDAKKLKEKMQKDQGALFSEADGDPNAKQTKPLNVMPVTSKKNTKTTFVKEDASFNDNIIQLSII